MNDFNIKKFLTENKMTRNSRLLSEELDSFTEEELSALDYHEKTGMIPDGMSEEEFDILLSKWRAEYDGDDFTDPAGGSGLDSHV